MNKPLDQTSPYYFMSVSVLGDTTKVRARSSWNESTEPRPKMNNAFKIAEFITHW